MSPTGESVRKANAYDARFNRASCTYLKTATSNDAENCRWKWYGENAATALRRSAHKSSSRCVSMWSSTLRKRARYLSVAEFNAVSMAICTLADPTRSGLAESARVCRKAAARNAGAAR